MFHSSRFFIIFLKQCILDQDMDEQKIYVCTYVCRGSIQAVFKQESINKFNSKHQFRPHLFVICFTLDAYERIFFTHFSCAKIKSTKHCMLSKKKPRAYKYLIEINIRTVIEFCSFLVFR